MWQCSPCTNIPLPAFLLERGTHLQVSCPWLKVWPPSLRAVKMFVDLRDWLSGSLLDWVNLLQVSCWRWRRKLCHFKVADGTRQNLKFGQGRIFFFISTTHLSVAIFSLLYTLILHLDLKFRDGFVSIPPQGGPSVIICSVIKGWICSPK